MLSLSKSKIESFFIRIVLLISLKAALHLVCDQRQSGESCTSGQVQLASQKQTHAHCMLHGTHFFSQCAIGCLGLKLSY